MLSTLNGELFFIVLEPVSLNNPIDYEHLQSYNISAECKKSTVRKPSLARGPTLAYHLILLNIYCKEQANIIKEIHEQKKKPEVSAEKCLLTSKLSSYIQFFDHLLLQVSAII